MSGIEPGTPGSEQRTTDPRESASSPGVGESGDGNRDAQQADARDREAENREERGRERMIDVEDDFARQRGAERDAAAAGGDSQAQAEQDDVASREHHPGRDRIRHAAEWLDGKLVPRLGPSDLGPYDEESEDSIRQHDACPLCGHPMGEHTIDRSTANAVLNCPVPPKPQPESFEPLNEVGMVRRRADGDAGS